MICVTEEVRNFRTLPFEIPSDKSDEKKDCE